MTLLKANLSVVNTEVPTTGRTVGIIGYTSQGSTGDFYEVTSLAALTAFGVGPAAEIAARVIASGGKAAIWRVASATLAYGDAPTVSGTIPAVTYDATQKPVDRCHANILFTAGGTVGTLGIKYKIARVYNPDTTDYGAEIALGTANNITTPDGIKLNIAAGAITTGARIINAEGKMPDLLDTDITAALARIASTPLNIRDVFVMSDITAGDLAAISTSLTSLETFGRRPTVYVHAPNGTTGQSPAAWLAATQALTAPIADEHIIFSASELDTASALSGGRSRATYPFIFSLAHLVASKRELTDPRGVAAPRTSNTDNLTRIDVAGPLPQTLRSVPTPTAFAWDSAQDASLDTARCASARTWPRRAGTFCASAPTLANAGTTINAMDHARVVSAVFETLAYGIVPYLGQKYRADKNGVLLQSERSNIEKGLEQEVSDQYGDQVSSIKVSLSPTDSISDGETYGVFFLQLLNSIDTITLPIRAAR